MFEELLDRYPELLERYVVAEVERDQLRTLLSMIIDNARLNYDETRLTVDSDKFMAFVKAIAPNDYVRRLTELKKEETNDEG